LRVILLEVTDRIGQTPSTELVVKLARDIAWPTVHGGAEAKLRVTVAPASLAEVGVRAVAVEEE
jgi:hypothetical protein